MRLKQNRLKEFQHRAAVMVKDAEGSSSVEYAQAVPFLAEEWPGGGKLQAQMYGIRLPNIRNLRIQGSYAETNRISDGALAFQVEDGPLIKVNDGVCLFVSAESEPDYRVVAIYPYQFLTLEVEKYDSGRA